MNNYLINSRSLLALRVAVSGIFLIAGINHLLFPEKVVDRLNNATMADFAMPLGSPEVLVLLSGIFMVIGGMALLLGFQTRLAAIGLILILLPITFTVQVGQWATSGPLFKNIAIVGGLTFFAINGSLCHCLDNHIKINSSKSKKTSS
jgi:putative oxidoreductase